MEKSKHKDPLISNSIGNPSPEQTDLEDEAASRTTKASVETPGALRIQTAPGETYREVTETPPFTVGIPRELGRPPRHHGHIEGGTETFQVSKETQGKLWEHPRTEKTPWENSGQSWHTWRIRAKAGQYRNTWGSRETQSGQTHPGHSGNPLGFRRYNWSFGRPLGYSRLILTI